MTAQPWYRWQGASLELRVLAKTRSKVEGLGELKENFVTVRVSAPPLEGKANKRLLAVVAEAFEVPKSRVRLIHGLRSRYKWIEIDRPERIPKPLKSALPGAFEVDQSSKDD